MCGCNKNKTNQQRSQNRQQPTTPRSIQQQAREPINRPAISRKPAGTMNKKKLSADAQRRKDILKNKFGQQL